MPDPRCGRGITSTQYLPCFSHDKQWKNQGASTSSGQSTSSWQSISSRRTVLPRGRKAENLFPKPTSTRQGSPPIRSLPPPLGPPANCAGLYFTVYETESDCAPGNAQARRYLRSCSMVVQRDPRINNFTEYFCQPASRCDSSMKFHSVPNLPDPRDNAPGLLNMDLIACIPFHWLEKFDSVMRVMKITEGRNKSDNDWINVFLRIMVDVELLTEEQKKATMTYKHLALGSGYQGTYPNEQRCFPA